MSVMIWALLEKSSWLTLVSSATLPWVCPFSGAGLLDDVEADEATSFRTRVFAKSTELSWMRRRTWMVVVDRDHSWPVTKRQLVISVLSPLLNEM